MQESSSKSNAGNGYSMHYDRTSYSFLIISSEQATWAEIALPARPTRSGPRCSLPIIARAKSVLGEPSYQDVSRVRLSLLKDCSTDTRTLCLRLTESECRSSRNCSSCTISACCSHHKLDTCTGSQLQATVQVQL